MRRTLAAQLSHVLAAAALLALTAPPTRAEPPPQVASTTPTAPCPGPDAAAQAVRDAFARLVAVHQAALPGPRRAELLARGLDAWSRAGFDTTGFAQDVLRAAWDAADEPARARWTRALAALLQTHYRARLGDPTRSTLEVVSVTGDCARAAVEVRIHHRPTGRARTLTLDLRLTQDTWRVRDVLLDGTSLMRLWRARFGRAYKEGGLPALEAELARIPSPATR